MDNKALARLVNRAKNGDVEAFAQIYSQLSKVTYYLALKMMKNEQDAVDVMQETFLKLFQNLDAIKNAKALVAYVNSMVYHGCLNTLSKSKRIQREDPADFLLQNAEEENEDFLPEQCFEREELREMVLRLVDELGDNQRTVVLLYYFEQLTVKQIAGVMRITEAAVMNRLSRARAALREKTKRNPLARGSIYAMSVPVLTRILQAEADMRFTPEVSRQIWQSLGAQLGLPAAATAAAVTAATAGASVSTTATVASLNAGVGIAAGTQIFAIIATAAVVGSGVWAGVTAIRRESENLPEEPPPTVELDISPGVPLDAGIDINLTPDLPESPRPSGDTVESLPPGEQKVQGDIPTEDLGRTSQRYSPGEGGIGDRATSDNEWPLEIIAEEIIVSLPKGSQVTEEDILAAVGVSDVDANGNPLTLKVHFYDKIDFKMPGQYALLIDAVNAKGEGLLRKGIIVEITEE